MAPMAPLRPLRVARAVRFAAAVAAFVVAGLPLARDASAQARVSAGGAHVCAVTRPATGLSEVRCWGSNRYGQLGLGDTRARGDDPGEMGANLPLVALGAAPTVALALGSAHTCALDADGAVRCWGDNVHGQLGLGDRAARGDVPGEMGASLPAVALPAPAQAIAAGAHHTCALLTSGTVACWGRGEFGQLGLGDRAARGDAPGEMGTALPTVSLRSAAAEVTAGATHTCARLTSGAVQCWGDNVYGQLGLGDRASRGDGPGEMGADLPLVALPGNAAALATGDRTTCAVLAGGSVACWGLNAFGQLGLGDTDARGDAPGEMAALAQTPLLAPATAVALGASHACALLGGGGVQCGGSGEAGRLGLEDTRSRGDGPGEMGAALPLVAVGAVVLPVELSAFTAATDGGAVVLRWTTLSETTNAGFGVEVRGPLARGPGGVAAAWREAAFVAGRGTTSERTDYTRRVEGLPDGRHEVRLRQVDTDGAARYSAVVGVEIRTTALGADPAFRLVTLSPNPFRSGATFALTLDVPQRVRIAAFDALGRDVARLHDGPVDADLPLTVALDGSALAPGAYVLRVDGERFRTSLRIVRAR